MMRRVRLGLMATAICAYAAGAAGWVSAQQGDEQAGGAAAPASKLPPPAAEEPPPAVSALKGAVIPASPATDSADVQPDEPAASSAAARPAPEKPVEPMKRPRYAFAVIQAMDKVTAETMRFEVAVGKPIRYKSLIFIVRACETTAPDEAISDAAAHIEIDSEPIAQQGSVAAPARQVFRGWMFANSPGLNLFQSPAYDAWLIACKTASPAT